MGGVFFPLDFLFVLLWLPQKSSSSPQSSSPALPLAAFRSPFTSSCCWGLRGNNVVWTSFRRTTRRLGVVGDSFWAESAMDWIGNWELGDLGLGGEIEIGSFVGILGIWGERLVEFECVTETWSYGEKKGVKKRGNLLRGGGVGGTRTYFPPLREGNSFWLLDIWCLC